MQSVKMKAIAAKCNKASGRVADRSTRHIYPVSMWRMVADVMGTLPNLLVSLAEGNTVAKGSNSIACRPQQLLHSNKHQLHVRWLL
jgi:hypothetical protein